MKESVCLVDKMDGLFGILQLIYLDPSHMYPLLAYLTPCLLAVSV